MPLPDMLQFLGLGRKTGILRIEAGVQRKALYVENGLAIYCSSGNPKEYLGQQLLARTSLTEAELERAFQDQRSTGRRLGEILVASGRITEQQLEAVLRNKIEDSMYELLTWTAGTFTFEDGPLPQEDMPVRLAIGWQDLVMEGARRADEIGRIKAVIPGPHARFHSRRQSWPPGFPDAPADKKLVALVDEGCSAGEICARFHASDLDVLTRLKLLVDSELIELDKVSLDEGRTMTRDEILRAATDLSQRGHHAEAWGVYREGASRYFDDNAILAGLRASELRLRRHFAATLSDLAAVPELAMPLDQIAGRPLSSKQAYVVSRINGSWSVKSIVQICPFDELEALCILEGLAKQGLVRMRVSVPAP